MRGSHIQKHGLQRPLTLHFPLQKHQVFGAKKNFQRLGPFQSESSDKCPALEYLFESCHSLVAWKTAKKQVLVDAHVKMTSLTDIIIMKAGAADDVDSNFGIKASRLAA